MTAALLQPVTALMSGAKKSVAGEPSRSPEFVQLEKL
jgi:hypothetical protein